MPKQYEAMRDKFVSEGMGYDAAQGKAARIYNAMRSKHPTMQKLSNKPEKKVKIKMKKYPKNKRLTCYNIISFRFVVNLILSLGLSYPL